MDENKNDENKNNENCGKISDRAAKCNEIRFALGTFLLQPIVDLATSYVFDKDIDYICTFVYSGFFRRPNLKRVYVSPTIVLNGIIYKLESVELSTTVFLFIYDDTTKKLIHSVPLAADCGIRLIKWDTICIPSSLNSNNNVAGKFSDKIFVSSCVEDSIYVFCTLTGKVLYMLRNLSKSESYGGNSISRSYKIKLTNDNKTVVLLTIDRRSKKRFIKFIDIDRSCEKIAAEKIAEEKIEAETIRIAAEKIAAGSQISSLWSITTKLLEYGVVSYDCYFNDHDGIFDFCIDGSIVYLFNADTIFTFDMHSKKIIHSTKQSAMKMFEKNVIIYNDEIYKTGQIGYEILVCDLNNNYIMETKLLEGTKFENNRSCSEYLLKNFMNFYTHRSWSDTNNNNLYHELDQIESMSINGDVVCESETESTIAVGIMTDSKISWSLNFTAVPGAINFVVNTISALYPSGRRCLHNPCINDEDDDDKPPVPLESIRPSEAKLVTRVNTLFPKFDSLSPSQRHIFFNNYREDGEIVSIENGKIYVRYGNDLVVIGR